MRFDTLRHVRDDAKAVGPAHHLLLVIATHVNYHTGEARVSVKRLAHALDVTPRYVQVLLNRLVACGDLLVSHGGGHATNTYRIPMPEEGMKSSDELQFTSEMNCSSPQTRTAVHPKDIMKERKKTSAKRCGWGSCEAPICPHEVNFCAPHGLCQRCAG
jgi:hypothetical protein